MDQIKLVAIHWGPIVWGVVSDPVDDPLSRPAFDSVEVSSARRLWIEQGEGRRIFWVAGGGDVL